MKKILPLVVALTALLLAACGGTTTTTPAATATRKLTTQPTNTTVPQPTATPTPIPGGCMPVGLFPDPYPLLPPPAKDDWSKGPENARIAIIEYSDFQ